MGHNFDMKKIVLWPLVFILLQSCGEVANTASDSDGVASDEHRVFVTSTTHTGNLGGISGANSICNTRADAAGLTRNYEAILSDDSVAADSSQGLSFVGAIYIVDSSNEKTLVAGSGSDLWSADTSALTQQINVDENGNTILSTTSTWTGTNSDGGSQTDNCSNWSSSSSSDDGEIGDTSSTIGDWVEGGTATCNQSLRIYCVSQ